MTDLIVIGACLVLGFIITVIGLTRGGSEVTHENRAEVARGLYEHFTREEM